MSENNVTVREDGVNLPFNIPQITEEAKEQLDGITLEYPQLKIPSAGSLFFEIDEQPVKELQGVIVYHGPRSMYYATDFDGSNNPPDCYSNDRITGHRKDDDGNYVECNCEECEFSKFGSDPSGNGGKACKEKHQLYIACDGRLVPFSLLLPVSSTGALNAYATSLFSKGQFLNSVLTSFTLEKATSKTGIVYSKLVFKALRTLTADEKAVVKGLAESIKKTL